MDGAAPGFDTLIYERPDHVARITLNRPHRRNALNRQAYDELEAAFRRASADGEVPLRAGHRRRPLVLAPART